jgi:hypothetical protein
METNGTSSKSIFDIIEERSSSPEIFSWGKNESLFKYDKESYLFEGDLTEIMAEPTKLKVRRYVLTLNSLIKYKV